MQNEKTIAGLKMIAQGIDQLIDSLAQEGTVAVATKAVPTVKGAAPVATSAGAEDLSNISYNDLKKLAKSRGVSAIGTREEIIARIESGETATPVDPEPQTQKPAAAPAGLKSKVTPIKPVEEPEEADPVIVAKVNEATKDMSNEEIANFLVSIGIRAAGKREALIAKVIKAVEEGKITLDETEDEAQAGEEAPVEEDTINDFDNPNMTEERKAALTAYDAQTRAAIKKKEITANDMVEYLSEYYNDDEATASIKALSLPELIDLFIDTTARFIDDDGNEVEDATQAYMLNGEPACCGMHLTYDDSRNTFVCGRCGQEFEAAE